MALVALTLVIAVSTLGYMAFGFPLVDALFQTFTTISTVGYREIRPLDTNAEKLFTIGVIVVGVGSALYTLSAVFEAIVQGEIAELVGRRRMDRNIAKLSGHLIVCGFGRVGREITRAACEHGADVVVVDRDPDRCRLVNGCPVLTGDATDEAVLRDAGIERAKTLIAALAGDAENLFVTLTARGLNPDVFIITRARTESSEAKMEQAGANRVVNPQRLGGARMAAFAHEPAVTEFVDVIMHERSLDYRLAEVPVPDGSPLAGRTVRDTHIRDRTGALVLGIHKRSGKIDPNPGPETSVDAGDIVIAIGTPDQLDALRAAADGGKSQPSPSS
jgi:voltage-gated potassium channel